MIFLWKLEAYIDTESKQEYGEAILYHLWLSEIYILSEMNFHQ